MPRHTNCFRGRCIQSGAAVIDGIAAVGEVQHMIVIIIMHCDAGDEFRQHAMHMRVVLLIVMQHHIQMPGIKREHHLMLAD